MVIIIIFFVDFSPNHSPKLEQKQIVNIKFPRPGPINNSNLIQSPAYKVPSLTGEGGKLRKNLCLNQNINGDFQLVSQSLWTALTLWYGGEPSLPRQVKNEKFNEDIFLKIKFNKKLIIIIIFSFRL